LQSLFLKIDVAEIVVHKTDKPNTVVDLSDAHGLTRERSAEINFLFENADPPAVTWPTGSAALSETPLKNGGVTILA
jgi:hypothetical protein